MSPHRRDPTRLLWQFVLALVSLLILKVTVEVVWGYRFYFPPDFQSEFLRGRERYFFHSYRWAFYGHLFSGPISLLLGLWLIGPRSRKHLRWHRRLGRIHALNVLLILVPSGLWMAGYEPDGAVASASFGLLSCLTGYTVVRGWTAAVRGRIAEHRLWMSRCFVLLCSAVVIRVIGGTGTNWGVSSPWFNPLASWISWVLPLLVFEARRFWLERPGKSIGHVPRPTADETMIELRSQLPDSSPPGDETSLEKLEKFVEKTN